MATITDQLATAYASFHLFRLDLDGAGYLLRRANGDALDRPLRSEGSGAAAALKMMRRHVQQRLRAGRD